VKTTSSFSEKVYAVVRKISCGQTLTYGEVARLAGSPHAARAVGTALSKNFAADVPCHRVLRSDGGLGGYNRGLKRKIALLKSEGVK